MAQTLEDFIKETKKDLDRFYRYWTFEWKQDPENFPLTMEKGNEGLWWEFFEEFLKGD